VADDQAKAFLDNKIAKVFADSVVSAKTDKAKSRKLSKVESVKAEAV
jgi:hypothetical protein